jgi:hypothetical protein
LNIKSPEDWYRVKSSDIKAVPGGERFLSAYDNSLHKMLSSLMPRFEWVPWNFEAVPRGFWNSIENQKQYLEWLAMELGIKKMDQWYSVQVCISLEKFL